MIKLNSKIKRLRQFPAGCAGLLSAALLGGLLLSGCSEHEDMNITGTKGLSITASLEQAQTRKANDPTTLLTSGSLGVFLSDANHYTARSNVKYTYAEGSWSSDAPVYLGFSSATLCAYYPYDANVTDAASVALTSRVYAADKDLCYTPNSTSVNADSPQWELLLGHAYSEVTLHISRGASFLGDCSIGKVSLLNAGLNGSGTLDLTSGTYSNEVQSPSVSGDAGVTSLSAGDQASLSFLLVPATGLSGELTVALTVDGHTMLAHIDAASAGMGTLKAGMNYEVSLTVDGDQVSVSGVSTTDWVTVPASGSQLLKDIAAEANCYIVAPGGSVGIPVSIANKSDLDIQLADVSAGWSSEVIWRDNSSLEITTDDALQAAGAFTVKAMDASATGNALVAIKDGEGNILWSWHIWVTDYDPATESQSFAGTDGVTYTFMDRNLGAVNDTPGKDALGLLYQWGRKDPFAGSDDIASSTLKILYSGGTDTGVYNETLDPAQPANTEPAPTDAANNLENSVRHPGVFYTCSDSPYDWYPGNTTTQNNDLWKSTKTVYDPCPTGWKVAPKEAFSGFSTTTFVLKGTSADWSTYPGRFLDNKTTGSWYPASGNRNSSAGALLNVGAVGYYWSSAVSGTSGIYLVFNNGNVDPGFSNYRANGFAVRCVQD